VVDLKEGTKIQSSGKMTQFNGLRFENLQLANKKSSNMCFCNAGGVVKRMSVVKIIIS